VDEARAVREFWFGELPLSAGELGRRMQLWFGGGGERWDEDIRNRFGALLERAAGGALDGWADGPRRRLSLILLLDQFPRNMFRGTARAFAYDDKALALTLSGLQSAADAALDLAERIFFYMPLQHAESREAQDESVAACRRLLEEAPADVRTIYEDVLAWADRHRAIIEQFGRFPHRNALLGRVSTLAEEQWLRAGEQSFAQ
jgi:uncharacterized protein (DUF924 family)